MITARRIVLLIDRLYELAAAPSVHHEQIPQIAVRVRSAVIVVPSAAGNVPKHSTHRSGATKLIRSP